MGHAGPRTNTNVLNYNIGEMNKCFSLEAGVWVFHPERVTPARAQSLGEMLGGMNSDYNKQYPDTPFPTDPESGGTTPPQPPTSGDVLARVKAAPSQRAIWCDLSDAEATAMIDAGWLSRDDKNRLNNWYHTNGVKMNYDAATGLYHYFTYTNGEEHHLDTQTSIGNPVRGTADADTEEACGQAEPGPFLPPS